MVFKLKRFFRKDPTDEEYIEIDLNSVKPTENKIIVKPFVLRSYDDVNDILNSLREGYTIVVIDMKPLKAKDMIELKRAVAKIKKTVDALEGSIAIFSEHTLIATPSFAQVHKPVEKPKEKKADFIGG